MSYLSELLGGLILNKEIESSFIIKTTILNKRDEFIPLNRIWFLKIFSIFFINKYNSITLKAQYIDV